MELSMNELEKIKDFFQNDVLANCFISLFNYQRLTENDIFLEIRGNDLIGFKKANEKLRLYIVKSENNKFFIKIRSATRHLFIPEEMINYQSDIDITNKLYNNEPEKTTLNSTQKKDSKLKPKKNSKSKNIIIESKIMRSGKKRVTIKNLDLSQSQIIIDELKKLSKGRKTKKYTIKIMEE